MTEYTPLPPAPAPPRPVPARNGIGTAGFVLGLIGLVLAPIPFVGLIAWPVVVIGLVLSILGVVRARGGRATNKGLAVAGIVVSALGLAVCVLWTAVIGKAVNDVSKQADAHHTIAYEVTGTAKDALIAYSTFDEHTILINSEDAPALPWTKTVQATGFLEGNQFTATAGAEGGSVTCKVTVDGKVTKTATASGPLAVAACTGF